MTSRRRPQAPKAKQIRNYYDPKDTALRKVVKSTRKSKFDLDYEE